MAKKNKRSPRRGKESKGKKSRRRDHGSLPEVLPVMPGKDLVAFPSVMMSLYVARPGSIKAVEDAFQGDKLIFVVAQSTDTEQPQIKDLYKMGVIANVVRTLKLPDGRYKVLLQGLVRAIAQRYTESDDVFSAKVKPIAPKPVRDSGGEEESIMNRIRENMQVLVEYEHLPEEMLLVTEEVRDAGEFADVVLAHYKLEIQQAQRALEELDPITRLKMTDSFITDDLNRFIVSEEIRDKARDELSKGQKEFYLREQIKQIQRELGEDESSSEDLNELRKSLERAKMSRPAHAEALKQLKRLSRMSVESSEYSLLRTYLEWLADLPWAKRTIDRLEIELARKILEEDHYGLEKTKDRILEYLSVRKLNKNSKGPILCLVGPPGVGKTSLGQSIARALNRRFFRLSLGGVRDEAEIRGHRRTYVGALPGRIVQGLKQVGSKNPVFVLDELDKIGADFRGDPASALLEVLDPSQNKNFVDHYLNLEFDLSEVMFVATANTVDTIPDALLDRLEVIYIAGYTTEEKLAIAKRFLIPRQLAENGLGKVKLNFEDKALLYLIERYTREAGVRNLEREIGALCRKVAREFAEKKKVQTKITIERITKLLGTTKFDPEPTESKDSVGLVRGLAWTIYGGEMMPVEASIAKGSGQLTLTGQLGSVMQESAQAALFYARANNKALGLTPDFRDTVDFHIHVPAGATPKDGPSAGITIATALVSALLNLKVSREIAMTGEITLRGNILPVGGLKEKALAALRHGIKKIIIPYDNIKDLDEIPKEQRSKIKFIPVRHISEVLELSLLGRRKKKAAKSSEKQSSRSRKSSVRI
ncbi:MAG: endopeptidase La [Deltaproteobacteria bacterium]|nr:endopeptidase La [Deltaproteobacteria bacterium]